ncbi:unnamed protein product [Plutella xylostella]|uniref:(diamondback moth) hypothetical protein n=1 Tax=Plutella xylostella TaxID=51655 RepID=A0A8S4EED6_PLUXY|nr:unnamed protein product [Plutella xylostella]
MEVISTYLVRGLSLRDVRLVAPDAAARGSPVLMRCLYSLEQEMLYSVKWYRGDREFCRYSPRDVPPLKVFHIPGIDVLPRRAVLFDETSVFNGTVKVN